MDKDSRRVAFEKELEQLINKYSQEMGSNTPDFLLAKYLIGCLNTFESAVNCRENWYGRSTDQVNFTGLPREVK